MTSDNLDPNNLDPKQGPLTNAISRFLGGAALGILVVLIPVTYGAFNDLGMLQAGIALLLIVLCGSLSVAWGETFVEVVMRVVNRTGL